MAFIYPTGSSFQVRQGNNQELLSTFSSRSAAEKEKERLHKKNHPKETNKGASAKSRFAQHKSKKGKKARRRFAKHK